MKHVTLKYDGTLLPGSDGAEDEFELLAPLKIAQLLRHYELHTLGGENPSL